MTRGYYTVKGRLGSCGHRHTELSRELARCWNRSGGQPVYVNARAEARPLRPDEAAELSSTLPKGRWP